MYFRFNFQHISQALGAQGAPPITLATNLGAFSRTPRPRRSQRQTQGRIQLPSWVPQESTHSHEVRQMIIGLFVEALLFVVTEISEVIPVVVFLVPLPPLDRLALDLPGIGVRRVRV